MYRQRKLWLIAIRSFYQFRSFYIQTLRIDSHSLHER